MSTGPLTPEQEHASEARPQGGCAPQHDDVHKDQDDKALRYQELYYQQQQQLELLQRQQEQILILQQQLHAASLDSPSVSPVDSDRPKRRRGSVSFCEDVFCYVNPRSLDEIISSWYSRDELSVFKEERRSLVRELKKVKFDLDKIDRSRFHLRGLEPYLSVGYNKLMTKKRLEVLQNVLSEQKKQRSQGYNDVELLRDICRDASAWAREKAEDLGRRDAKAVGNGPSPKVVEASMMAWGHESDMSTPSLCSTLSSSTAGTKSSIGSEGSLDSLQYMAVSRNARASTRIILERVDEVQIAPCS